MLILRFMTNIQESQKWCNCEQLRIKSIDAKYAQSCTSKHLFLQYASLHTSMWTIHIHQMMLTHQMHLLLYYRGLLFVAQIKLAIFYMKCCHSFQNIHGTWWNHHECNFRFSKILHWKWHVSSESQQNTRLDDATPVTCWW